MRIGFYVRQRFHDAILRPVYDLCRARHDCLISGSFNETVAFRPHLVVQSEGALQISRLRASLPTSAIVHMRPSLALKNAGYPAVQQSDYTCLSSDWVRAEYVAAGVQPRRAFWITGNTRLDPLFRGDALRLSFPIPPGNKIVLLAPTYKRGLSCVPMLGERTVELIRGRRDDISLIIKPHPLLAEHFPEWAHMCRSLAANDPQVHWVEDAHEDVVPYLAAADVLISDASGVALEFLALNRPMVLLSNPQRFRDKHFNSRDLEWRWRDMGQEIHNVDDLPNAVAHALNYPDENAVTRTRYRTLLFGDFTDGRAAERLAHKIDELQETVTVQRAGFKIGQAPASRPGGHWF